jgi:hypothetical protein
MISTTNDKSISDSEKKKYETFIFENFSKKIKKEEIEKFVKSSI